MSQTATDRGYALRNDWQEERRRLALLEQTLDPTTINLLDDLGVGPGWRVLEVGAGGGSITRWLCDRVGEAGRVTAIDLDPRFLQEVGAPNLEVVTHDLLAAPPPGGDYDLVHVRALLMHLPGARQLVGTLLEAARPGGLVLIEEGDCYPLVSAASAQYSELFRCWCRIVAERGGDWSWARNLPADLAAAGAREVAVRCQTPMFNGGSPLAEFWRLSVEQVMPLMAGHADPELVAAVDAALRDPAQWFPFLAMISAWGRRPG